MASVLVMRCSCEAMYAVYIPKATLVSWMGDREEMTFAEATAIDAEEQAADEVEMAQQMHEASGQQWVDHRDGPAVCSSCGREFAYERELRFRLIAHGLGRQEGAA
jgi:hypothetical protein